MAAAGASSEDALTSSQPVLPNATRARCVSCPVRPQRAHPGYCSRVSSSEGYCTRLQSGKSTRSL